ncbi:unnamed protein product [Cylindrotheca closterium]|uniref:Uncharacterized protein n=1 Tax=Cylindrotheca closterium TaxID=2856 RepID=A0AAD2CKG0_9STRA|nr:unnamed protein product [Cylindrotheca closterium]
MGLRFTEETTTAVYEFEKMTWDEMDEVFYTEEEIGDFRHSAFMIECGLEEEDWAVPDVEPTPWNKEVDAIKIKNFATNLGELREHQLKAKREHQLTDSTAKVDSPPSNTSDPVESEAKPLHEEPKLEPKAEATNPVMQTMPPIKSESKPETEDKIENELDPEKITTVDSKSSIEDDLKSSAAMQDASARTATTESTLSTHDSIDSPPPTTVPLSPLQKTNKSAITKENKKSSPKPLVSPIQRSYSMDTRRKDKSKLDKILKSIESPTRSPKKTTAPTLSPIASPKSTEDKEVNKSISPSVFVPKIPPRSLVRTNSLKKGNKKNRSKVLASLDNETSDMAQVPVKTKLKPTKSADLEHMRTAAEEDLDKSERKLKRNLMRTTSGSMRNLMRPPRRGKKGDKDVGESPTKPKRRTKKNGMHDSSTSMDLESVAEGSEKKKKKKRSSLSNSQRSLGSGGSAKKRSSLKRQDSSTKKKRPSLNRGDSSMSAASSGSMSKRRPSLKRNDSSMSATSSGSKKSKRRSLLKQLERSAGEDASERKPRRGMKKQESLRLQKEKEKKNRKSSEEDPESSLSEDELNDLNTLLSPIREPKSKRGTSADRSLDSQNMSSISSGVSFLGSIDAGSVGSDRSIGTFDDDEDFDLPSRPTESDGESENQVLQEFYRYMKSEPTRHHGGVKVYTVYKETTSSHNGKATTSRNFAGAALVLSGSD